MSAEDELIQRAAAQLDQDAPTISINEIEQRTRAVPVPAVDASPRNSRRWAPIALAVAAVALTTGGIALALTSRSPAPTLQTGDTLIADTVSPSTTPTPTTEPTTQPSTAPTTETVDTTVATTTAPPEPASIPLDGDPAVVLAAIDADRADKLRSLDGFTATVLQTNETLDNDGQPIDSQPGFDSRTTLLSNGSMWSDLDGDGFASYDATTGESRGAIPMPTGEMYYQLIEGWTENSTGLSFIVGHDPAQLLTNMGWPGSITFEETTYGNRPAWRVEATNDGEMPGRWAPDDLDSQVNTYVVDQATGLIVVSSIEWEGKSRRSSELVDLVVTDQMPAEFPGEFPDGAVIVRSGDPSGFQPLTLGDAADRFGTGFFAPPEVPSGTTIRVDEYEGDPVNPLDNKTVEIRAREGFVTTWTMFITKTEIGPSGEIPDGYALVDGTVCIDFDQDGECDPVPPNESEPVANAALSDFSTYQDRFFINLQRNGLTIAITGSPAADPRSVAETLIAW